jgi:hypothetical protein
MSVIFYFSNHARALRIIRNLKPWIQKLEKDNKILGFAFNHYSGERRPNYLRLRFDFEAS